jgi:hypothetical protein
MPRCLFAILVAALLAGLPAAASATTTATRVGNAITITGDDGPNVISVNNVGDFLRIGGPFVESTEEQWDAAEAALHAPRNAQVRLDEGREIVSLAAATGDRERLFDGHEHAFWAAWELGDPGVREVEFRSMAQAGDELRQPAQLWILTVTRATLALAEGGFAEVERLIERRAAARQARNFEEADHIRDHLAAEGVILEEGTRERSRIALEIHDEVLPYFAAGEIQADNVRSSLEAGDMAGTERLLGRPVRRRVDHRARFIPRVAIRESNRGAAVLSSVVRQRGIAMASGAVQYVLAYAVALPMFVLYRIVRRFLKRAPAPPPHAP